ncbi:MAG: hypothetical protein PHF50_02980 [Patescibacteria group bacterium]|nr:hypothetical protein [Patescibacteria group bacterium]
MADIKPETAAGESLPLSENPLTGSEKLKQSLELFSKAEEEKANNFEQARKSVINEIYLMENTAAAPAPAGSIIAPMVKRQKQVENVLSEGLADIYLSLTPAKRQEFKIKGEQTANKINQLLAKAKINIGEIIELIKKWLSLIPGVNKYFLEQEAKIKADELIKLRK